MRTQSMQKMTASALLIAIGIVIPMFFPGIRLPPASFTLASHVAVFVAMIISPGVAVAVTLGTTIGFLLGGFDPVIVLRAASHLIFATGGSLYLRRFPKTLETVWGSQVFSLVVGVIHALCEVVVVTVFYFGGNLSQLYYDKGFFLSVLLLIGLGSIVHSMFDFILALFVLKALERQKGLSILTKRVWMHS